MSWSIGSVALNDVNRRKRTPNFGFIEQAFRGQQHIPSKDAAVLAIFWWHPKTLSSRAL
jgi:hypothetical protein